MKIETKILCYSGRQKVDTKAVKQIDYTIVDMGNGVFKKEINTRQSK